MRGKALLRALIKVTPGRTATGEVYSKCKGYGILISSIKHSLKEDNIE
jgi:hypothetical protein